MKWDPNQYARFSGPRSRPFFDLIAQIRAENPRVVVDVGCGDGSLTATLKDRWPNATVRGVDSSPEMAAKGAFPVEVGRAQDFDATGVDVLLSNAMLQWVPGHEPLLRAWCGQLAEGAWLALQVPDNFDQPSYALMRALAQTNQWRAKLADGLEKLPQRVAPETYLDVLAGAGFEADVWQTDYLHVLPGEDPVLEWVRGTALRPLLAALSADDAAAFEATYAAQLRAAYPKRSFGTVFPFRRTFAVGRKRAS